MCISIPRKMSLKCNIPEKLFAKLGWSSGACIFKKESWLFSCRWSVGRILAKAILQPTSTLWTGGTQFKFIEFIGIARGNGMKKRIQLSYPEHENRAKIHFSYNQVTCIPVLALAVNHSLLGLSLVFLNTYESMGLALSSAKSLWSSQHISH